MCVGVQRTLLRNPCFSPSSSGKQLSLKFQQSKEALPNILATKISSIGSNLSSAPWFLLADLHTEETIIQGSCFIKNTSNEFREYTCYIKGKEIYAYKARS